MYMWTDDTLRWMMAATRRTPLYSGIVGLLDGIISSDSIVCDAGCGTGGLSLALAPKVREVIAVDSDKRAVELLTAETRRNGIENLTPVCADIFTDRIASRFDTMVFCRFGGLGEILPTAYRYDSEKLVIIKQKNRRHRFDFQQTENERRSCDMLLKQLGEARIPYQLRCGTFESGQPFTSMDDARAFFRTYEKTDALSELTDAQLQKRLIETRDADFPYYLPAQAEMCAVICELRPAREE